MEYEFDIRFATWGILPVTSFFLPAETEKRETILKSQIYFEWGIASAASLLPPPN